LLQLAGAVGVPVTVGYVAERLGLRHNTVVELCDRCEQGGLLKRRHDDADRRRVLLALTRKGHALLESLSADHARELNELAPEMIRNLSRLKPAPPKQLRRRAQ
jgi:DNA-binding MarR family transcriptional regulator